MQRWLLGHFVHKGVGPDVSMSFRVRSTLPLSGLLLLFGLMNASAQTHPSALGSWEFDEARLETWIASVKAGQRGGSMPEIAIEMGLATLENTVFTFGIDARGPHLVRTDKVTGAASRKAITIRRDGADLLCTEEGSGTLLRLRPIDAEHLLLIEEARKISIPLQRR